AARGTLSGLPPALRVRAHLLQAADGALKREAQVVALIEFLGRHGRRAEEVDRPVVELVDHGNKAPRLIVLLAGQPGNARHQHSMEAATDLDVVGGAARATA